MLLPGRPAGGQRFEEVAHDRIWQCTGDIGRGRSDQHVTVDDRQSTHFVFAHRAENLRRIVVRADHDGFTLPNASGCRATNTPLRCKRDLFGSVYCTPRGPVLTDRPLGVCRLASDGKAGAAHRRQLATLSSPPSGAPTVPAVPPWPAGVPTCTSSGHRHGAAGAAELLRVAVGPVLPLGGRARRVRTAGLAHASGVRCALGGRLGLGGRDEVYGGDSEHGEGGAGYTAVFRCCDGAGHDVVPSGSIPAPLSLRRTGARGSRGGPAPPPAPMNPDTPCANIRIGYSRFSHLGQELRSQLDALAKHGIPRDKIFSALGVLPGQDGLLGRWSGPDDDDPSTTEPAELRTQSVNAAGARIPACREYSARLTQETSHDHCAVCLSPPAQQPTALSYSGAPTGQGGRRERSGAAVWRRARTARCRQLSSRSGRRVARGRTR